MEGLEIVLPGAVHLAKRLLGIILLTLAIPNTMHNLFLLPYITMDSLIQLNLSTISKHEYNNYNGLARINKFIDGDTFEAVFSFKGNYIKKKLRLLGINAPETRTHDDIEKNKGKEASQHLKELCSTNEKLLVYIECTQFDAFGRILSHIYSVYMSKPDDILTEQIPNTTLWKSKESLNNIMLKSGYAVVF
jgi:endonuclease YncB( thermonuclease family)